MTEVQPEDDETVCQECELDYETNAELRRHYGLPVTEDR